MMTVVRVGLALLALSQAVLGVWTQWFPHSFYATVPTVDLTPPYSEHLIRDFGGATTATAVVLAAAVVWPQRRLVVVALLAYLAFSLPHAGYHLMHLAGATPVQAAALLTGLGVGVLLPLSLLVLAVDGTSTTATADVRTGGRHR